MDGWAGVGGARRCFLSASLFPRGRGTNVTFAGPPPPVAPPHVPVPLGLCTNRPRLGIVSVFSLSLLVHTTLALFDSSIWFDVVFFVFLKRGVAIAVDGVLRCPYRLVPKGDRSSLLSSSFGCWCDSCKALVYEFATTTVGTFTDGAVC